MSPQERRAGASLASLFGLRMLGLFLILPLLAVDAHKLAGGDNMTLVGLALGAYGLTQAFLQIPFGMASDRWGRKPVILVGLLLFAAGSFLAGSAQSIYVVIAGRAIQSAGAVSSVVVALTADLTSERHRTKAMAMIGSTIGFAFALSLIVAPVLYRWIGLSGVFYVTGLMSFVAIWLLFAVVPNATQTGHAEQPARTRDLPALLAQPELMRLNIGIFVLHVSQMAMFVVVPPMLVEAGLALPSHWKFYLRAVVNTILDVRIHCFGMTSADALALMVDGAFQERSEAEAKDERARLTATQLSTYFLGSVGCWDIEDEARRRAAEASGAGRASVPSPALVGGYPPTAGFNERGHLEAVISHGEPPIPLLRRILLGES